MRYSIYFILFSILFLHACVDDDFDHPPLDGEQPAIKANTTIADLKALHTLGSYEEITEDIIISGVVIADDRSGNFFRALLIQDSTAGIEIRMNETDLFNEYGEGRELFIKCNGLWLGDFAGITQLGAGTEVDDDGDIELSRLPSALFDEFIVKGQWNKHVTPTIKTIAELRSGDISTLVRLENMQFSLPSCERTYARDYVSPGGTRVQESLNQPMESCVNGATIILRSSGFSHFAGTMLPTGSGAITAVYSVFNDTKQLLIRDTDDVDFNDPRCGDSGVNGTLKTLAEIRAMYTGTAQTLTGDFKVSGTVISDFLNENLSSRNLIIQDETAGIVVRFTESHNFGLGEIMEININNVELSDFNGLLQLNDVEINQAFTTCNIGQIEPRLATVQEILNNEWDWQSTLVKVNMAVLSGGATLSGGTFVTDATGTIDMFTQSFASFAGAFLPIGEVDITAIIGDFNGVQLTIRNLDDIEGGDIGGDPTDASLADIRALYTGSTINVPNNFQVTGVVVSDAPSGNMHSQNLALQDATGGIIVRFTEDHPFLLGDELTITVRGVELSEFRTLLQLNNVSINSVTNQTTGTLPTPRAATVSEIIANGEAWESTLVKISDATISGSTTFNGNTMVTDATGSIPMFTRSAAVFQSESVPATPINLTALVTEFDGERQVNMRNIGDVE